MQLIDELRLQAQVRGAVFCRVVDIGALPRKQARGYRRGVVMGFALGDGEDFGDAEQRADRAADAIEVWLRAQHYDALSQSERSMEQHAMFDSDTRSSLLPHKTLAVLSGMGWIGRNNLLVTEAYGCRLTLGTVLTNAPLLPDPARVSPDRCGSCMACVRACPVGALSGQKWSQDKRRDDIVNVDACRMCLRCMQVCPQNPRKRS